MDFKADRGFWSEAFALHGSITPRVLPQVMLFGLLAAGITLADRIAERDWQLDLSLPVLPFEFAGAALGLLLILRTNSGYDRWWEARKLWGGIVNQSRNLAIDALAYGPDDSRWRTAFIGWTAAFPFISRSSLRGEPPCEAVRRLVGSETEARLRNSGHPPSFAALKLAELLREACEKFDLDRYAFLQIDRERAALIDHIGACERILKTPLPQLYSIKIRRFLALFLLILPFALLHRLDGGGGLVPLITMLVAYPLLSLDRIGIELQNPFAKTNLSHLPVDDIARTIERNLLALSEEKQVSSAIVDSRDGRY